MIYEVYLNDNLLYYPNDDSYSIINSKLETSLNEAGSFECDIPQNNMRYSDFDNGQQLRSGVISVLKDGVEIFCGEVREVTQNFDFTKHIYAVGELAYLFDSIQPQAKYQGTISDMFNAMLTYHNNQVETRKQYQMGNVLVTDPNGYIYHFTNREDTLTAIREKLCNTLDGYLKIRKVGGVKYLDLIPLSSYGSYCTQEIQFGENMLDYSANYTANDIATCVIPLGARFDEDHRTADAVEGLDEYLTIKGTSVDSYHTTSSADFVYIQSAVNRFGWVRVVKSWDDVTIAENLKTKAEQWLTDAQYSKLELDLSAVDLALLNSDIESFEVGDTVHAWAEPYNMDTTFPVRKKTIYLNDLSKNSIVLSNTETNKSYTRQVSDAVSQVKEDIPQTFTLMEESKSQALSMLLSQTQGGYVVNEYHYDSDGKADYIEAINICDQKSIDLSLSRWRWSYNGLGFLQRNSTSDPWPTSSIPVAITNDGKINADQILTGTLDADTVRVHGKIEATSGYIGSQTQGWDIGSQNIHNGPISMSDGTAGMYVGVDGIRTNGSGTMAGAYTTMSGGLIRSNQVVTANGFYTTGLGAYISSSDGGTVEAKKFTSDGFTGTTGTMTWLDRDGRKAYGIGVENGIVYWLYEANY